MINPNLNDIAFYKYQGGDVTSQNLTTILRPRGPVRRARYLHHHDRHDQHYRDHLHHHHNGIHPKYLRNEYL